MVGGILRHWFPGLLLNWILHSTLIPDPLGKFAAPPLVKFKHREHLQWTTRSSALTSPLHSLTSLTAWTKSEKSPVSQAFSKQIWWFPVIFPKFPMVSIEFFGFSISSSRAQLAAELLGLHQGGTHGLDQGFGLADQWWHDQQRWSLNGCRE